MKFREGFWKIVGLQLAAKRKEKGLRQEDVANTIGVTKAFISAIEKGKRAVPESLIPQISASLDFDFMEFLHRMSSEKEVTVAPSKIAEEVTELFAALPEDEQKWLLLFVQGFVRSTPAGRKQIRVETNELQLRSMIEVMGKFSEDFSKLTTSLEDHKDVA